MTTSSHKFKRSTFAQTISVISLTGRNRLAAQLDFWGPIGLVCMIGILTKCVQELLAN